MSRIGRKLVLSVIVMSSLVLVSCRTMHGLGEDISSGGKALANAAEPSKKKNTTVNNQSTKSAPANSSN